MTVIISLQVFPLFSGSPVNVQLHQRLHRWENQKMNGVSKKSLEMVTGTGTKYFNESSYMLLFHFKEV